MFEPGSLLVSLITLQAGNLLYEFTAPEGHYFKDAGFTNDGERVVAIIDDGSAMVGTLYLTIDEMLEAAANR